MYTHEHTFWVSSASEFMSEAAQLLQHPGDCARRWSEGLDRSADCDPVDEYVFPNVSSSVSSFYLPIDQIHTW